MDATDLSIKTVIVALDGSGLAERALPIAAHLSRMIRARLLLLVVMAPTPLDLRNEQARARSYLASVATRLAAEHPEVTVETRLESMPDDHVARAICDVVHHEPDSIVVMSTHGRSGLGRWLYGSVADEIVRMCTRPVCLVGPTCDAPPPADRSPRLLVTLDGSAFAEQILPLAAWMAHAAPAEVLLLQVLEPLSVGMPTESVTRTQMQLAEESRAMEQYLRIQAAQLAEQGVPATIQVEIGYPPSTILRVARDQGVALITLATHGRGGLARTVLGGMATTLLAGSPVPLLLVRPSGLHETIDGK